MTDLLKFVDLLKNQHITILSLYTDASLCSAKNGYCRYIKAFRDHTFLISVAHSYRMSIPENQYHTIPLTSVNALVGKSPSRYPALTDTTYGDLCILPFQHPLDHLLRLGQCFKTVPDISIALEEGTAFLELQKDGSTTKWSMGSPATDTKWYITVTIERFFAQQNHIVEKFDQYTTEFIDILDNLRTHRATQFTPKNLQTVCSKIRELEVSNRSLQAQATAVQSSLTKLTERETVLEGKEMTDTVQIQLVETRKYKYQLINTLVAIQDKIKSVVLQLDTRTLLLFQALTDT